jgi:hypothetical protein
LQVEPVAYLTKSKDFYKRNGLDAESGWYEKAMGALGSSVSKVD